MIAEFINANELGLAREQMADVLSEDAQPLSADERADMLALVDRMQMGERVPRALAFCPQREVGQALGGMSVRARPPRPRVSHWHVAVVKNAPVSTMAVSSTLSPWNEQDGKSDVRQVVQRIEFLLDGQPLSLHARDEYIATPESYLTVFEVDPSGASEVLWGHRRYADWLTDTERVPVMVCPCGDLNCGALTVELATDQTVVRWSNWGWDNFYDPMQPMASVPTFEFDPSDYTAALAEATREAREGGSPVTRARVRFPGHSWRSPLKFGFERSDP